MKSNWIKTMELITISIGIAIIVLGVAYVFGGASIPPALVMGISIAGLCFTISDFIIKLEIGPDNFIKSESSQTGWLVATHFIVMFGIIWFPNFTIIENIGEAKLETISTFISVIALGTVILAIGWNNRREVINDINKQYKLLISNQENLVELKAQLPSLKKELKETQEKLLQRDKEIEQLQLRIEQSNKD
ncbi:hypothetical protein CN544_28745 [Bacillus toyonensis]|uniref:hypothetical protein n=1 Tax=Bacillus toyonensis TaxID=155322 RepID=UPI000BF1C28B|nr:hypothetical protein [Bacillus toyonensis]PEN76840.1 hypothetical protein CN544_28745 [Bacillus toyonensis]